MSKYHYDYIICGAGCAGLSLAMGLCDESFQSKRVLLLDKVEKITNDRTWSYWEKGVGAYDDILHASWNQLEVNFTAWSKTFDISPFIYKMIRGIDFYEFAKQMIQRSDHIDFQIEQIHEISEGSVSTSHNNYTADWVFSSIPQFDIKKNRSNYVHQHFGGWMIKSKTKLFNPRAVRYMDFRIAEDDQCKFAYVLPRTETEALVEIASFSNDVLTQDEYDRQLEDYIEEYYGAGPYEILEKEYNVIPMTSIAFEKNSKQGLSYIGVYGGASKASTGYAFDKIQQHTKSILQELQTNGLPKVKQTPVAKKYRWFDHIFGLSQVAIY